MCFRFKNSSPPRYTFEIDTHEQYSNVFHLEQLQIVKICASAHWDYIDSGTGRTSNGAEYIFIYLHVKLSH